LLKIEFIIFTHSINVRTIITPEHRYAKIMKEKLNEDELSILNLGPTHCYARDFPNVLLMDGERILEAEPTIGYIHRAFEKIAENRPFTK
jgi:NADH-quinone oxidoreductase subunit D